MTYTVVRIRRTLTPGGVPRLDFSVPGNPADDRTLTLTPDAPPVADFIQLQSNPAVATTVIQDTGTALLENLRQHDNFPAALANTINALANDPTREVRIEIQNTAKVAHNFPWEALHDPAAGFIALGSRVPFSRMVPPAKDEAVRPGDTFDGTLKILAVIAAAGIPGMGEWDALRMSLASWTGGLDCRILVDDAGFKAAIEAAQVPDVTVQMVPETAELLMAQIGGFTPHILHLFCHGRPDAGGFLEIANNLTAFGASPLYVTSAQLAPELRATWLVLLNACSTGQVDPAANTNSIACALVEQGVPFVTSMRQEVPFNVAHRFARSFLAKALEDLDAAVQAGQPFRLRLAPALMESRNSILALIQGNTLITRQRTKEWTLPILCAAPSPFEVRPAAAVSQAEAVEVMATIRELKLRLDGMQWSPAHRAVITAQIAALEALLAPVGGQPGN